MQHKQTATGLAALGRKGDTELVHMTKGEIHGLQKLAMAHGGSLTINPETGLPEANFLKSIMPMVVGAGLAMTGIGAPMAALMVGGGSALMTGSLEKGLMAGLGAYGGAGIVGGLSAAGAGAAGAGAAGTGATTAAGANMAGVQSAGMAGFDAAASTAGQSATQALGGGMFPATSAAAAPSFAAGQTAAASPFAGIGTVTQTPTIAAAAPSFAAQAPVAATPTWESIKAGAGNVTGSKEAFGKFLGENKYPLMAGGISAISGMGQEPLNAPETDQGMIRPYTFNRTQTNPTDALGSLYTPGQSTRERNWFEDSYTAGTPYKAPGPEYMANGGPVEAMSNDNTIGANTGYPMSNIQAGEYATPYQQPISRNVVTGSQDAATNPYTGQAQFADGGDVSSSIIGSIFAQNQQDKRPQYVNNSVGGYDYNQDTGAFSRSPEVQAQQPQSQMGGPFGGFFGSMMGQQPQQPEPDQNSGMMGGMFGRLLNQNQRPQYANGSVGGYEYAGNNQFTQQKAMANGGITALSGGGSSNLGSYSDGGQLLRGPGDGVSDSIEAQIGNKQPARIADGEFVVPARIVSELGNGSTEAGSRQLYAMMDRVQNARKKSIGKGKVAANSKAAKLLPA
jgi:hypothetical protein